MSGELLSWSPRPEAEGSCASSRVGSSGGGPGALALEAVTEAPGLGAGVDDVRAVREAIDDGLREPRIGEDLGPFAEGQVGGDDQAAAFVALGEDLEDELGGAVGQREVAELVDDDELGAGVTGNDAGELAAALGFLEFVGEPGEGGEADAAALLAGADRQGGREHRLAGAAVADEDHGLAVGDPGPFGERGDRGLRDARVVGEVELFEAFDLWEARVDQAPAFAALSAFGDLGFQ
jgi:hypothetical protein